MDGERMNTGWVKDHRSTLDWEWFTDVPVAHLWEYIRLKANIETTTFRGITIPRGSFNTSEEKMSIETGLSRQQIRTALKKLLSTKEITKETTNGITVIKVVKFNDFQSKESNNNQQITDKATNESTTETTNTLLNKKKRREEEKNIYKEFSPEFIQALNDFKEMRKKIKKPLTDKATEMVLVKLSKLAVDEETQIEILNQSTMNCWQSVYPLDTQKSISREKRGLEALMDL